MSDGDLESVYRAAVYRVHVEDREIEFKIGEECPQLDEYFHKNDIETAALITAFNPRSLLKSPEENQKAQQTLYDCLRKDNRQYLSGYGADTKGTWPPEESALILNLDFEQACQLANQFNQAGFCWLVKGKPVQLIML